MTSDRHQDEEEEAASKTSSSWGTWEELLLASAVKRHGPKNWDSVSMELQTKTSLPHLLTTAQFCKQKYMDLKRRFKDDNGDNKDRDNNHNIPWLEHLRQVRVDELKQDLQRYDLSIHCLQLKVKKLEEERESCLDLDNNNTSTEPEPDLNQHDASLNDKTKQPVKPDRTLSRLVSGGEESDRENRSVNESNSTGRGGGVELVKREAEPGRSGGDGDGEGVCAGEDGTTKESEEELGDSVTQLSSDVQSSASYGRKKRRVDCSGDGDAKSEPLIGLLNVIRTHKHASLLERRLKLQESTRYKEIVRQHVELEIIQTRLEQGSYSSSSSSSCTLTFYRDLLLLFNNAILFFPKSSVESTTAHQLRQLVSTEINKEPSTHKPDSSRQPHSPPPQPEPNLEISDSLLQKQKTAAPIIVCRKRSSVSAKASSTFAQKADQQQQSDDKKPAATDSKPSVERNSLLKLKTQDKGSITGTRTSRRNNNNNKNPTNTTSTPPSSSNKKQSTGTAASGSKATSASASVDKQETSKTYSKKKTEASSTTTSTSDKKKSVVDFLKRIKKNSPVQTSNKKKKKNNKGGSEEPKRNNINNKSGKKDKKGKEKQMSVERKQSKDSSSPKKNVGRPPKKAAETAPATGKRSREVVVVAKRQSKRTRR